MNLRRRNLIAFGSAVFLAPRLVAAQRPAKVHRVGWLGTSLALQGNFLEEVKKVMRDLGYIEGQNIVFDSRWAEGKNERLPALATELVALQPDLIASDGTPGTLAAKQATATIPIVMIGVGDPVRAGFVASLGHPGGNITGYSNMHANIGPKNLELLHTVVPNATRIAVLISDNPSHLFAVEEIRKVATRLGLTILPTLASSPMEFEKAFASMTKQQADALIVMPDTRFALYFKKIGELVAGANLPTIGVNNLEPSGLLSYGWNTRNVHKIIASYLDKILKGAKPSNLPVQQPTEFELVINMKTAKALGITIPQEILLRADRVIE